MRTSQCRTMLRHFKSKTSASANASASNTSRTSSMPRTRILESRRTIVHNERMSTNFQIARTALATEASSLRYAHYVMSETEESLPRGWDDMSEEDDGT